MKSKMRFLIITFLTSIVSLSAMAQTNKTFSELSRESKNGLNIHLGVAFGTLKKNQTDRLGYSTSGVYGALAHLWYGHFGLGLDYRHFEESASSGGWLKITDKVNWVESSIRYRFLNEKVSPFIFGSYGVLFESVRTEIPGSQADSFSNVWGYGGGAGLWAEIYKSFNLGFSTQYSQYLNRYGWLLSAFAFVSL